MTVGIKLYKTEVSLVIFVKKFLKKKIFISIKIEKRKIYLKMEKDVTVKPYV